MGYKKLRKKYKTMSPSIGKWLKWIKLKIKGHVITTLTLCLLIAAGCGVEASYTDALGRTFKYKRTGSQQIGEVLLELADGSTFLMDGQKSELPKVEITATSITIGGEKVGQ